MGSTLFEKILLDLKNKIDCEELKPGSLLPTEYKLAEQYGVSRITAKRALDELKRIGYIERKRGSGSYVRTDIKSFEEHTFPRFVSLVLPFSEQLDSPTELLAGLNPILTENNIYLSIMNSSAKPSNERKILEQLYKDQVSGVILYPSNSFANTDIYLRFAMEKIPFIIADLQIHTLGNRFSIPSVSSDNFSGGYQAAQHLYELGHRKMSFVSIREIGPISSLQDRYLGFCAAQQELGNEELIRAPYIFPHLSNALTRSNEWDAELPNMDLWKSAVSKMLDQPDPPTALFCCYDLFACSIVKTLQSLGVRVPEDISIVGFDNTITSRYLDVPLTTLSQDFKAIGSTLGKMMISMMSGQKLESSSVVLPVELIRRKSTAPPPGYESASQSSVKDSPSCDDIYIEKTP